jgi:hypothetical protein
MLWRACRSTAKVRNLEGGRVIEPVLVPDLDAVLGARVMTIDLR